MVSGAEDGVPYSFALEYSGPPVAYDLPLAVPIKKIPVATVVKQLSLPDKVLLPVVKPLLASGELKSAVSPTSVMETNNSREMGSVETPLSNSPPSHVKTNTGNHQDYGSSLELSFSSGLDYPNDLLNASGSSSRIEFSAGFDDNSMENSSKQRDYNESNHDWHSNESSASSYGDNDDRRSHGVTFCDQLEDEDDDASVDVDYEDDEIKMVQQGKQVVRSNGKKGTCYRCCKGNRFTEKEVCIVCDAKYCSSCVLRAMGSMPEGRKCVTCIGYPIDELKRGSLGKCSRLLKRLLNVLEVRQIMKTEKSCQVNQLPPEYVCVNELLLCQDELVLLQSCANPPKKLKPGNYWYDKVSGFWGNEGHKPSQIITPHLSVGGQLKANASNGNTEVYINGREITSIELRMLQLAGVQCAGNPHFWVNEDGSYQEEGQKNTKGYIWGKTGMKLVSTFLSLPVPSKSSNSNGEQINRMFSKRNPGYMAQKTVVKLLLVGCSGSGTSTIFKQAKILYKPVPFTEDERENIKLTIQTKVYGYLGILMEGRDQFEEAACSAAMKQSEPTDGSNMNVYSIGPRLKAFSDWLLNTMVLGKLEAIFPAATREYAPLIEELWKDDAIQATYKRWNELELLPTIASYFLDRVVDILKPDYEPSDLDILYADGVTSSNGLACLDFSYSQPDDAKNMFDLDEQHDSSDRYQLVRVQTRGLGESCRWLELFDDIGMVIFCISLSDYDHAVDLNGFPLNKMIQSRKLFESIVSHPTFNKMEFLLILNKFDLFEEKIERGVPLSNCEWFDDFHPVISRHRSNNPGTHHSPSLGQLAFHYVSVKFKKLFSSLTRRKLYVSGIKGLESTSVDSALKYAREILKWSEQKLHLGLNEYSTFSTDAATFTSP